MKKVIIIVLIAIAYILIALGMEYYVGNDIYLFMGGNVRFHYSNGSWTNDAGKSSYTRFQVYDAFSNNKIGTYNVRYTDGWYIKTKNKYVSNNDVILYKGKGSLKIMPYEVNSKLDNVSMQSALKKYNLPTSGYNGYYIDLDIDADGENEKIYCLKNYYSGMYVERNIYYSLIYILDGDTIKEIVINKSSDQPQWSYVVSYIIDVNNDDKYEIFVGKSDIELNNSNIKIEMYGLEDNKYVKLVSTE